ncbi:plasmid stabilization system protein ParE [Neorhizobium galegae]|uniref:type II toxin-antitoxin system RelE/ParE family toxin n=1 Tax=Neorhizobium galegae TaxID=399 RepID=UPI001FDA2550|nr:type II toxin-antitoxin system RelE/ParE family toxin [Neorhizobium galegae]MBP2550260.1 plasmid stabilization system protein ParE [Neorhizobium galegae]
MVYRIKLAAGVGSDFDRIFDHLLGAYLGMGDSVGEAYERAAARVTAISEDLENLAHHPYQGTLHNDLQPDLRHVTKDRAIFYFQIDEENSTVNVLAIFFGGQDHRRHMLKRLSQHGRDV